MRIRPFDSAQGDMTVYGQTPPAERDEERGAYGGAVAEMAESVACRDVKKEIRLEPD